AQPVVDQREADQRHERDRVEAGQGLGEAVGVGGDRPAGVKDDGERERAEHGAAEASAELGGHRRPLARAAAPRGGPAPATMAPGGPRVVSDQRPRARAAAHRRPELAGGARARPRPHRADRRAGPPRLRGAPERRRDRARRPQRPRVHRAR
ncbi:MAG: hypothetical protein ACK559_29685, partial [bacterium]